MKKVFLIVFIAACMAVCAFPSLGMAFAPESKPIGNEKETKLPSFTNADGSINTSFPTQLGEYFEKHFAFRPEAISADARIQSSLFSASNNDLVIVGSDDWLYYRSTLDDHLGNNVFSERQAKAFVRNLELVRSFCESRGVSFLFTVAPNKNSLYPEHMPYYYGKKVSSGSNREMISKALSESKVQYCDLFKLFESKNEVLYFARDSHWNNTGALMVYDAVLTQMGKSHDDYSTASKSRKKDFVGDLAKMLYPSGSKPEYNTYYGAEERYQYITAAKSVEDPYIKTENADASGSLFMYRDSFGNSLLPFFASAYNKATFTKAFPMLLENEFDSATPDAFIMELVERNLDWLLTRPPVISARETSVPGSLGTLSGKADIRVRECEFSPLYTELSGSVDCGGLSDGAEFSVLVKDAQGKTAVYEAYSICTDESDFGFRAYLPADAFPADSDAEIKVIAKTDDMYYEIKE